MTRRTDYETGRPPFAIAEGWDRLVLMTRARDRLRVLGATDGYVVHGNPPRYRSRRNPNLETFL